MLTYESDGNNNFKGNIEVQWYLNSVNKAQICSYLMILS